MDFTLPKFTCKICGNRRQQTDSTTFICTYCRAKLDRKAKRTIIRKIRGRGRNKGKILTRTTLLPRPYLDAHLNPIDLAILQRVSGNVNPLFLYNTVYMRQAGRCARCLKRVPDMRVVFHKHRPTIKSLVCDKCYGNKTTKLRETLKSVERRPWQYEIWKRADTLTKLLLINNPTFNPDPSDLSEVSGLTNPKPDAIIKEEPITSSDCKAVRGEEDGSTGRE